MPIFFDRFRYSMLGYAFIRERIIYGDSLDSFEFNPLYGHSLDTYYMDLSI